ncbi:MAG: TspO/MBR family protein [Candidatus Aenigmatarchaeota archaeon]
MNKWIKLLLFILICQGAGIFGSIFTAPSIGEWYVDLNKPFFTPPSWMFGPVWISLYTLMGISLYLVWDKRDKISISLFSIQLGLNAIWSLLFFGLQNPLYGLAGIIPLWFAILLTIIKFYRIDKKAGLILIPYILWVTVATALNYYILILN